MSDNVQLLINNQIFEGWESLTIKQTIKNVCASFSLTFSDRWKASMQGILIQAQSLGVVTIGGEVMCTGYVDDFGGGRGENSKDLSCSGRSLTADLVDCSGFIKPGNFAKGVNFFEVAKKLCKPYGIKVLNQTTSSMIIDRPWIIGRADTVIENLNKGAKILGVLLVSDNAGNLVITNSSKTVNSTALVEGMNVKDFKATVDFKDRYQTYEILAQAPNAFDDQSAPSAQQIHATATDPNVKRHRVLTIMDEGATTFAHAKKRAEYEMRTRAAKSVSVTGKVAGWRDGRKQLWKVNQLAPVRSSSFGIDENLLISEATFTLSPGDVKHTEFLLERPDAYLQEPLGAAKDPVFKFSEDGE